MTITDAAPVTTGDAPVAEPTIPTPVTHGVLHRTLTFDHLILTETSHPGHLRLPRHSHTHAALTFILAGGFTETFGPGRTHECRELSLLFKPAGAEHSNHYAPAGARSFIVECTVAGDWFDGLHRLAPQVGSGALVAPAAAALRAFRSAAPEAPICAEELAAGLIAESNTRLTPRRGAAPAPWLLRVAEEAREGRGASLARLARSADVHPVYLARAFRRGFGMSIGEYLMRQRMDQAVRALLAGAEPISRIAARLGFSDQSHFTRRFRREIGSSPARYRRAGQRLLEELRRH
jgi:AraC family transcriptional regulator